ncbi:MAG: AAA family ATPase, partial [Proteobacteria bacterium]|nr:AAA family ATPase [Pseudomonadota bacterium]
FGLNKEPFSNAPDVRFYYNSAQHQKAMLRLQYAVDSMKGFAILIGDIGTGKTTLARMMLDALPEEAYESALLVIIHSGITADWLLKKIALQLGVDDPADEKLKVLNQIYGRLMELDQQGKKAVVLVDEAQMLKSRELMEEFRGLSNLEVPGRKLITFVFFGLPEIEENLKLDPPLLQRVALKYRLEPLNEDSTDAYIRHRLRISGSSDCFFAPEAISAVHIFSRGIPRMINTICDNALFEAYLMKNRAVNQEVIESVARDLGLFEVEKAKVPVDHSRAAGPKPEAPQEEAPQEEASEEIQTLTEEEEAAPAPEPEAPDETIVVPEEKAEVEDLIRELEEESKGAQQEMEEVPEPKPQPRLKEVAPPPAPKEPPARERAPMPGKTPPPPLKTAPAPPAARAAQTKPVAPEVKKPEPKKPELKKKEEPEVIDDIDKLLERLEDK